MYEIRLAIAEDVPFLQDIENIAGDLFLQFEATANLPADPTPIEEFFEAQNANLLWVAALPDGKPVGFALTHLLDGGLHLEEVDVHPDYGRRGIGTKLIQTVCRSAQSAGFSTVTLTTFRDIPWNAPFYQKLGFRILAQSELTPELLRLVEEEERRGLAKELRVVMRIELAAL
ncbi:MAG: GNAT family N-acetyltransferase [Acidobacteria bacterium]|nr:GNAT family N-acetyltransferase [Acidobacteriota bacterium]